jgi:hypothetical protein
VISRVIKFFRRGHTVVLSIILTWNKIYLVKHNDSTYNSCIWLRIKVKGKVHPITDDGRGGGGSYSSTLSLTSALDRVGCQRNALAILPPGKTLYPLRRRLVGPQDQFGRVGKISHLTRIRSSDLTARSESLYRLSYHGYRLTKYILFNFKTVNPLTPNELWRRRAVSELKIKIPSKNMREKPSLLTFRNRASYI